MIHQPLAMSKPDRPPDDVLRARAERMARKQVRKFRTNADGMFSRSCPICEFEGLFVAFGHPPRRDVHCPECHAPARHRLMWLYLDRMQVLSAGMRVLHFAPEFPRDNRADGPGPRYETADHFSKRRVDHGSDIQASGPEPESFDVILCSHVREHVEDRKTLRELCRILKPGGVALRTTPVIEGWAESYENPDVVAERDRLLRFGQGDHLRYFGRDIRARILDAGFDLEEFVAQGPDVNRHGLLRGETLFIARRPAA